ncbi:MAG TPA: hypothetical protein VEQ41_09880 [Solirubrobacterales bacterium]|nr:hypothetical protein [Solirubrobacterales bacterium]
MRRIALLPLLLVALLAAAPVVSADDGEEADESGLVEEAIEDCELDPICEAEAEAEEAEEAEEAGAAATGPPECLLRSAKAHAALEKDKLKLTIGYTTSEPTKATIEVRYGATKLGPLKRHLRRSGVLRVTKKLKDNRGGERSRLRIELDTEGVGCPSRRLVLFPK